MDNLTPIFSNKIVYEELKNALNEQIDRQALGVLMSGKDATHCKAGKDFVNKALKTLSAKYSPKKEPLPTEAE